LFQIECVFQDVWLKSTLKSVFADATRHLGVLVMIALGVDCV